MKKLLFALFIGYFSSSYSQTDYSFVYNNDLILKKGISLYEEKKYAEAIKEYEKISKVDPKYLDAQYEKAMALSALEKKEELKAFFEDLYAKKLMPEFPTLYTLYGNFLSDQKEYDQAEKTFKEGEKYLPNSSNFLYNLAILYIRKEESQKAVDVLERIITNDPNHSSSHYLLGAIALDNGKIVEASLAMMSYLAIAPNGRHAEKAITNLNAKYGQNYLGENKIVFSKSGDNFEEMEVILRNQLPLKSAYKVKSEIDDVIIRQIQAIAEYSLEHKMGNGFFETMYIPWIKDMMEKQRFEAYSYYILQSMEEKIGKKLSSKKKLMIDFNDNYILAGFWDSFGKRKLDHFGTQQEVIVSIKNMVPYLIGQQINGKSEGKYKYLNGDGNLAGELNFKNNELDGYQKYFDAKGILNEEKSFKNGKVDGTRTAYYPNGLKSVVENYADGVLNGLGTSYYVNGGKQCEVNFVKGERDGKLTCLYPNGSIKSEANYVNGKLNGLFSRYNEVGDIVETYTCVNDLIDGKYLEYYDGKLVKSEADYANGKIKDSYKTYYSNGTLEKESTYEGGKIKKLVFYFSNGKKSSESFYNDKEELEAYNYFDSNGNKYFEEKYKSGELKSAVQYLKNNPKPVEISLSSKPFTMKDFDGNQLAAGNFEKGKKTGEWNHHFISGTKRLQEFYSRGNQNGLSHDYNKNGEISSIKNYSNDTLNGLYEVYENGKLDRSYSYEKGRQNGPYKSFYTDGSLKSEGFLVNGGTNFEKLGYWQNGTISKREKYIEDVLTSYENYNSKGEKESSFDCINKTGKFTISHNNGATTITNELVNGELNGKLLEKDKFNNPLTETEFVNGQRHNGYKEYSPLGTINREITFYAGKMNGLDKIYDIVGNLRYSNENSFGDENGKLIRYYHNKSKMQECTQLNGLIEGNYTYFNQKGEPILIIGYQNNVIKYYIKKNKTGELNEKVEIIGQNADIASLYPNGKTAITIKFEKGNIEGKFAINNELGKPEYEANYSNNSLNGTRIEYYVNGNVYKKEHFKNDDFQGIQEYFKEDGKPWLTAEYKNDELHGNVLIYNEGKIITTKKYDSDELVEIIK
ncbi:Antitoxin component YwqK of the YwqJK toxin-antitoxin module [Flavobacterium fluvii]|uniref:Antitoxin component YwqK of the YwqJK toxin-antitoxin module n=1 Tax=Flavobacterium fluvii TaxID=468056 RepID=A0A1M5LLI0_9FLAO|nr:toxin-antitoxin system YwqK family antitoxin [Flavobacterium fluvii]SHG65203.1 Antitoxin component YwqK of the YwqJK toxin-antitoxin module [Flavobacterium fluvii]